MRCLLIVRDLVVPITNAVEPESKELTTLRLVHSPTQIIHSLRSHKVPRSREVVLIQCVSRVKNLFADDSRGVLMNFVNRASSAKTEQGEEALEVEIRELARRDNGDADLVNDDAKLASNNLGTLMRRMSLTSTREIDSLMSELKALRQKVVIDGDRVERQLAEYAELNQSVTQLTKIISDGLTHLKREPTLPKAKALEPN
jgi:hypothetical protein